MSSVYTRRSIERDPRHRRAHVWGLLAHADQTGNLHALWEAGNAIQTIGNGSKTSPREQFEARYMNIANRLAMSDPDTATIVALGRRVLQEPFVAVGYVEGHILMHQSIRTPGTSIDWHGNISEGMIAHVAMYSDQTRALSLSDNFWPTLIIAKYNANGAAASRARFSLRSHAGNDRGGIVEHANLAVDPVAVRLLADRHRAITAEIAQCIMDAPVLTATPPEHPAPEPALPRITTLNPL